MAGSRQAADRAAATEALTSAKQRAAGAAPAGSHDLLTLQRRAGNEAVSALLLARSRSPGAAAVADIDTALRELRHDEPAIEPVETGLRAAKAAGVPVDLEGPKPPPAALAVVRSGFGPGSVAPKKPVPPPKPVPPKSPLARFAGKTGRPPGAPAGGPATGPAPVPAASPGAAAGSAGSAVGQLVDPTAPPAPPTFVRPDDDAAYGQVKRRLGAAGKQTRAHPPAASKAKEAQSAALPPADDLGAQAKASKVEKMDAQQPGAFDKVAFIAAVKTAIEAKSPKTLKEADSYRESGKAGEVKGEIQGLVSQGKDGQAKDITTATDAPPDQSTAVPKPVTPMAAEQPGAAPTVPASGAAPKPAPADQLNLAAGPRNADAEMAEADVTDDQLARSNEPEFTQAAADKKTAAEHSAQAPAQYRQQESQVIQQNKAEANAEAAGGLASMQTSKASALAKLVADKGKAKTKDEAKRAEVTGRIQAIFTATEADVKKILDGIDAKVEKAFGTGEAAARQAFESYVDAKMSAYKKDRYGGWLGGLRWAKDKLLGMPDKVNEFYEAGREIYLKQMDGVISRVADIVGDDLTAAKRRIATGKTEIAAYVKSLPADLQKVGSEASKDIGDRFADLESEVDAKQESVVDTLATKYVEARKGLDERIEALQAENKGLVDKAIGAIKAVINTIRELASMLKNVLARAAGVVGQIIKDPIGFLGNLIAGIKGGILKFKDNILDHLRKGLMSWLFGSLAEAGIELPDSFDIKGIIKLLASIFGLTWANVRNRVVKQIGETAMAAVESGVEIFSLFRTQGVGGLWQLLLEKLGNIKEMILDQVKDFVITKIITAGITWLIGLLNPAAAFIKACKLIYDVVMFFVTNGSRILAFVNTILDSVSEIVRGNVSAVVDKINNVLGQMIPIIIGFLASVIGLGGIGQKIREIITKLQKPVNAALDFVIKKGLALAGPVIRGLKGVGRKVKAKVAAGKAWVKGKAEAGKKWVKGKAEAGKTWGKGTVAAGLAAIRAAITRRLARPRAVTMLGANHHLFVQNRGGRYIIMMASTAGELAARLDRAATTDKVRNSKSLSRKVRDARGEIDRAQIRLNDAMAISDIRAIRQAEGNLFVTVDQVEARMIALGREFDIDVLAGGKYVLDGKVHPDFQGKVRVTFYGHASAYRKHLASKLSAAFAAKAAHVPSPLSHPNCFWCPGVSGIVPPHLARVGDKYALDHKVGVATHWKQGAASPAGNNSTQVDRRGWYSDPANLEVLCRKCNSIKQSGGDHFDPDVGPNFTGPNGLR